VQRASQSICIAIAEAGRKGEVRSYGKISNDLHAMEKVLFTSATKLAQQATDFLLHARFEGLVLGRNPPEMETVVEILRHVTLLVETRDSGWLLPPEGPPVRRDMEQLFGQVMAGAGRRAENFAGADEQLLQPSRPVITGDDVMEGIRRDRSLRALPIEEVEVIIRQINLVSRFAQLDEAFAHALRPRAPELTLAPA
jgi:hypothetical protein